MKEGPTKTNHWPSDGAPPRPTTPPPTRHPRTIPCPFAGNPWHRQMMIHKQSVCPKCDNIGTIPDRRAEDPALHEDCVSVAVHNAVMDRLQVDFDALRAENERLRRSPTAAERAVERIKAWCEMAHNPEAPQTLVYAEKYVCDHVLDIIREEEGR